jgi:hypothetical protein
VEDVIYEGMPPIEDRVSHGSGWISHHLESFLNLV